MFFAEKTSIGGAGFPSRKPKPNDERSQAKADKHDKDSRQHNFKHCSYHRALFFARDVAFLAFMSGRVFPILKSGAPVFWQLVAVHGSYGHTVIPVVAFIFSAHTAIIAWIFCKINHFSFPYDSLNLRQANKHCAMPSIYPSALSQTNAPFLHERYAFCKLPHRKEKAPIFRGFLLTKK